MCVCATASRRALVCAAGGMLVCVRNSIGECKTDSSQETWNEGRRDGGSSRRRTNTENKFNFMFSLFTYLYTHSHTHTVIRARIVVVVVVD